MLVPNGFANSYPAQTRNDLCKKLLLSIHLTWFGELPFEVTMLLPHITNHRRGIVSL